MDANTAIALSRQVLVEALLVAAPVLGVSLVVGVVVALFQALTSLQEQTVAMIPKLLAVMVAAALLLAPALELLRDYAERVFAQLVSFGLS